MTIQAFPTPTPSRDQSQDVFDPAVEAFLNHLPTFVSEANAVAVAMNLNSTTDTSVSSVLIGTGAKTFTVSTGKSFQPGMFLMFADSAAPTTNWILAQVTSYTTGTGALVVNGLQTAGSGTIASWVISQTSFRAMGVVAGDAVQVDQAVTAWTRAATTTLGTSLNGTLSDTATTVTAFNGVAGVTYHVRALGAGQITHHATNLIVTQGGASITTAAGATFDVEMLTATTCRIKNYVPAIVPTFDGTYTPTLFNTTNVAASTAFESRYVRVGNVVTVTGVLLIDPTSAGVATVLGVSIPIASNFASAAELTGTFQSDNTYEGRIIADTTNYRATFQFTPAADAGNTAVAFAFVYQVI